jgi:hypothetical protein
MAGWIGVDLDGTLAVYNGWQGPLHIGPPVPRMLARVKKWLAEGKEVRIFTARAFSGGKITEDECRAVRLAIGEWCLKYVGQILQITNVKDYEMIELWDDRAVQVVPNMGLTYSGRE